MEPPNEPTKIGRVQRAPQLQGTDIINVKCLAPPIAHPIVKHLITVVSCLVLCGVPSGNLSHLVIFGLLNLECAYRKRWEFAGCYPIPRPWCVNRVAKLQTQPEEPA